ncbi:uncharacterized protein JCM6883_005872 [Sporobolomyces salmoneus]|uniref:uncharacterized protein n=1 Tax=Sporobolomyces salmoneus TaxID=183962 RepID=UPI00316F4A9F
MLSEEEIEQVRADYVANGEIQLDREFERGMWLLRIGSDDEDMNRLFIYLFAEPQLDDLRLASSTENWNRGSYTWTISVAYELFSRLSLEYLEVQQPIFEVFMAKFNEVANTKAFKIVLPKLCSGEILGGDAILAAVFEKLANSTKPEETE